MLFPISHEDVQARRWPVLTTVLVVLNILCFIGELVLLSGAKREVEQAKQELVEYWAAHQELATPPSLEALGMAPGRHAPRKAARGAPPNMASAPEAEPLDQAHLDMLAARYVEVAKSDPLRRWGYVPDDNNIVGLFTHQFLHGGVLHLAFNMWFLWLCACNIEDRWGRVLFVPMYLSAAVVAALTHKLADSGPGGIPLIGASGAIAGAMGAFLVLFATTRIHFFYWYGWRFGTFAAPAWLMLPLWLGEELLWAVVLPSGGDSTAHFAHIGGFVYGAAFAGVMRASGWDRRLDSATEKKVTVSQDEALADAARLIDGGRHMEAITSLETYVAARPTSIDGHLELLRAAIGVSDSRRMGTAYSRLVTLYLRDDAVDAAADLHDEAADRSVLESIALAVRVRLARRLVETAREDRAMRVYAKLVAAPMSEPSVAAACLEYAKLLVARHRHDEADRVLARLEAANLPDLGHAVAEVRGRVKSRALDL